MPDHRRYPRHNRAVTASSLFGQLFLVLSLLFLIAAFGQRARARRRHRRGHANPGFYPTAVRIGNALHQLQAILRPPEQHVIELHFADEDEQPDLDTAPDPKQHLLRQAHQIRRGNPPDRITALSRNRG